jgi:hypothetical protein
MGEKQMSDTINIIVSVIIILTLFEMVGIMSSPVTGGIMQLMGWTKEAGGMNSSSSNVIYAAVLAALVAIGALATASGIRIGAITMFNTGQTLIAGFAGAFLLVWGVLEFGALVSAITTYIPPSSDFGFIGIILSAFVCILGFIYITACLRWWMGVD